MVHIFYIFKILPALQTDLHFDDLVINMRIDEELCSQFQLAGKMGDHNFLVPIYSCCSNSLTNLRTKIYDQMLYEIRNNKELTNQTLVYFAFARFTRIDLMRLLKKNDEYLLEFVQECDTSRVLYEPISHYKYGTVSETELAVFSDLINKTLMLGAGDYV